MKLKHPTLTNRTPWLAIAVFSLGYFGAPLPQFEAQGQLCNPPNSDWSFFLSLDEGTGPKYRKIGLNGFPIPDEKPQATEETDAEPEETFVDAFQHSLSHQVTDFYIPMQGTDLALTVRRNWNPEIWNLVSGLKPSLPRPDRPFGAGWSSNINANIMFVSSIGDHPRFPEATVTDENGATYRFLVAGYVPAGNGSYVMRFLPLPHNKHQQEVMATRLEQVSPTTFAFTRKMGTRLLFETTGQILFVPTISGINRPVCSWTRYEWCRLKTVTDRFGTVLTHGYPTEANQPFTMLPTSISSRGKTIQIAYDAQKRVSEITDPRGKKKTYSYSTTGGVVCLSGVAMSGHGATSYQYSAADEPDTTPYDPQDTMHFPNHFFYIDLAAISDPNGATTSIAYAFDRSRQAYMNTHFFMGWYTPVGNPRNVTSISTPVSSATFVNKSLVRLTLEHAVGGQPQPEGQRLMEVTDAAGGLWSWSFSEGEAIRLTDFNDLVFLDTQVNMPLIILYKRMTVSTPEGGAMVAEFDKTAGMALKSFQDVGATAATTFEYSDPLDWSELHPWLAGALGQLILGQFPIQNWGDPTKQTDGRGKVKEFVYDAKWRVMKYIKDERGIVTSYAIDQSNGNRLNETVSGTGGTFTSFSYSNAPGLRGVMTSKSLDGGVSGATTSGPLVTQYTIDTTNGNILREQVGSLPPSIFTYDANNNKATSLDPRGKLTTFTYDDLNRLTEVDPPGAGKKVTTYDLRGNRIAEQDENGNKTLRSFDGAGRLLHEARDMNGNGLIDGPDQVTSYTYTGLNSKASVTTPMGHSTTMLYDGLNRLINRLIIGTTCC